MTAACDTAAHTLDGERCHQPVQLRSSYLGGIIGDDKPLPLLASDAVYAADVGGVSTDGGREARYFIKPQF